MVVKQYINLGILYSCTIESITNLMLAIVTITKPNVDYHHLVVQTKFHCTPNVQIPNYYQISANYSLISSSSPCVCKSSVLNYIHLFFHPNVYWVYNLTTKLSSESLFKDALSLGQGDFSFLLYLWKSLTLPYTSTKNIPRWINHIKIMPPNSTMEDHYVTY